LLFLGRTIDGLTGGNLAVAQAAIGDVSTNENRAKNFGLIGAAFGLGFIIGPYIGGRLSAPHTSFYGLFHTPGWFGAATPFWFAAGLALANCLLVLSTLPETNAHRDPHKRVRVSQAVGNIVDGFGTPRLRVPLLTVFLFNAGFTFFTTFFSVYLVNKFAFTPAHTGDYFALVGLCIALAQGLIVRVIAKRVADYRVLRFSLFATGAMIAALLLATTTSGLYWPIPLLAVGNGLTFANTASLISRSAEMGRQGEAMGIYSSVQSLAQVVPSALIGYISSSEASRIPLVVASVTIGCGGLAFVALYRRSMLPQIRSGAAPVAVGH
jgi:DHA1 family tetracycline resistance protein-like MFS transporter